MKNNKNTQPPLGHPLRRTTDAAATVIAQSNTVSDNFKELGIDIDPDTVERMAKMGLLDTIKSVTKTAEVIKKRRESEQSDLAPTETHKSPSPRKSPTRAALSHSQLVHSSRVKDPSGIDAHRIRSLLVDLNSPGGNIHTKNRQAIDLTLQILEACYYRQQTAFLEVLYQGYPVNSKLDIHKLPHDVRFLTKEHFVHILSIFMRGADGTQADVNAGRNETIVRGPGVLFDYIRQNRETFGKIEKVVDLLALLDVIKNYSESHRRSFDYGNSKVKHDIAFWNLSSSNIRTPTTDYPLPSPQKDGDRVTSKGALRHMKYDHTPGAVAVTGDDPANFHNPNYEDTVANLVGSNHFHDVLKEKNGRNVFGFFEKGIWKLEPGNEPENKPTPRGKISHDFSRSLGGSGKRPEDYATHDDIREDGQRGVGVASSMNFSQSPRRESPKRSKEKLTASDLLHNSQRHLEQFDEKDKSPKKLLNHYFDTPAPLSPARVKPTVNAAHRKGGAYQQWALKGEGVSDALRGYNN